DTAQISGTVAGVRTVATRRNTAFQGVTAHIYFIPLPDSTGTFQEWFATADGHFDSMPLAPGAYRVLALARSKTNLAYRDPVAMRAYENQGQVVNLVPGQDEHLQLQLSPGD